MSLFLTPSQQEQVVAAIRSAELVTSGEVRVHIETNCLENDVIERAKQVFADLGMHRTDLKNGVLFYLATEDRKFAVLGDKGINERVPDNFWNNVRDRMRAHFKKNEFAEGLSQGIQLAGEQLKMFFPRQANDINELSDDISFG
jgi:uncharacterized membrane protein